MLFISPEDVPQMDILCWKTTSRFDLITKKISFKKDTAAIYNKAGCISNFRFD